MSANLVAPTAAWESKKAIAAALLPVALRFQFTVDGHLVLADSGDSDAFLITSGATQALSDVVSNGKNVRAHGSRIVAYE